MKYIILNDMFFMNKKIKKWLIVYMLIIFLVPFYIKYANLLSYDYFFVNIGLKFNKNSFIEILLFLLNICFYLYISLNLFFSNVKFGVDNLFNRITKKKYIIGKLLSMLLILLLIIIINFTVLFLIYSFLGIRIFDILSILIYSFIIIFTFCISVILVMELFLYKKFIAIFFLLCFIILFYQYNQLYLLISNPFILFYFILILTFFIIINSKIIVRVFERSF